jgi:hypothetical protein
MFFSNPTKDPDLNKISQAKNQNIPGIPEKDLLAFEKYADDEDVILLFRPVEPLTKTLHTDGKYPTKNFKIKGKSSSWGLWAGFIPMDQYYSKLNGASNEVIENANKEVQDCIQKQHAQSVHLKISKKRFQELTEKEIIFPQKQKEGKYLVIYCPRPHNDGTLELCYAQEVNTASGTEYAIYTVEKPPFYVLADTFLKRPLIADYDLLAIFSPWKNYGSDSKRLNPDITHKERCRKLSPREQRRSIESAEKFYAREDPNLGNIAPETVKNIKGLNKALNKGNYLECIHHNDDAGSYVSNPGANYPVTVIARL